MVALVVIILLLLSVRSLATFYTDYLWFRSVHFTSVFRGVLVTKVLLSVVFSAAFFLMVWTSLLVSARLAPLELSPGATDEFVTRYQQVTGSAGRWIRFVIALLFGIVGGIGAHSQWNDWVLFRNRVSFGIADPLFHRDVSFYVFELPFIRFFIGWVLGGVVAVLILTVVAYYLNGSIRLHNADERATPAVKAHVSVLLGVLALIRGVEYYFGRFQLVLSTKHVVDGATYTGVHAELPAKTLLIAIAAIAAGLFLYNIRTKGWMLPIVGVALWVLVWVIVGGVYPALVQSLRVNPDELNRERPYIERNIQATRSAYDLNKVSVHSFAGNGQVSSSDISGDSSQAVANRQTLTGVPLLDPKFVQSTFTHQQELRSYYQMSSLYEDRYEIGGKMTQTLLGVRELNENAIPGGGFVNQHLVYTHGFGAVASPASESGLLSSGYPKYDLSDIPPVSKSGPNLDKQPRVYFGEAANASSYVIADSKQPELDYENPNTGQQVTSHYKGSGGVAVGGIVRRTAFALRFGDLNLLLSGQVKSSSKVMYIRNVTHRIHMAAPFLRLGSNPYAAVVNGQIYWIQNAYTVSDGYPYSQQADTALVPGNSGLKRPFNYVRNSVKVVVNAYTGAMHFYVVDPDDPIIQAYEKAFPDLFTPGTEANRQIPGIVSHWRYPEDLFRVQTNMYGRYHLTNVSAFYTEAQAWSIAQYSGSGSPKSSSGTLTRIGANGRLITVQQPRMQPQYLVTRLPGQSQESFVLLQAFEPVSSSAKEQNNLTAFITASSNPDNYGQLNVYETPPNQLVNGPALVGAAINANSTISSEISLLDQHGSNVQLGNTVIVPIDQSLLYVTPLYQQANANPVPRLADVIVVYNGQAYDSQNASLDAALCKITNTNGSSPFASLCNTKAAKHPQTVPNVKTGSGSGNSSKSSSTTTTTAPTSTTTTTVPSSSSSTTLPAAAATNSVSQLLADAQSEFTKANADLKSGDLSGYQSAVNQAEADVKKAQQLNASG